MADEFATGLGILTGSGLVWMTLAGWYNTPTFESKQLITPAPESLDLYGQIAVVLREAAFWFAVLGALTFWVVIPAARTARERFAEPGT